METRNVTAERYSLYRLCECTTCEGRGKVSGHTETQAVGQVAAEITYPQFTARCGTCRGEGRIRDLVASCDSPEALGVAIVTLAREQEFEGCPIGILDTLPEPGGMKWLVRPWQPSTRNVSDAARVLARSKGKT